MCKTKQNYVIPILCIKRVRDLFPRWSNPGLDRADMDPVGETSHRYPRFTPGHVVWTWCCIGWPQCVYRIASSLTAIADLLSFKPADFSHFWSTHSISVNWDNPTCAHGCIHTLTHTSWTIYLYKSTIYALCYTLGLHISNIAANCKYIAKNLIKNSVTFDIFQFPIRE